MNPGLNKLLERQLKRIYGALDKIPKEAEALVAIVSDTYNHNDEDRAMIERSMEISSKELSELNRKLQAESTALRAKLTELEHINKLVLDRESEIKDLKKKISDLEGEARKPAAHEAPKPPTRNAPPPSITL